MLDPKGVPRIHQKTPVSASTISDGVILDNVYFDEAVEGGYGQSQFQSAWGGGMDVKVLDRKRFRSSTGRDGGSFGGVMNSPAIYLHCACCEDLVRLLVSSGLLELIIFENRKLLITSLGLWVIINHTLLFQLQQLLVIMMLYLSFQ